MRDDQAFNIAFDVIVEIYLVIQDCTRNNFSKKENNRTDLDGGSWRSKGETEENCLR
jgi:hypothetical protein